MKLCSVEGCGKKESARGWCSMHYWRWKEHGDLNHQRAILPTTCSIDDCERPRDRRGWCTHHYTQWWKYGDPLFNGREKQITCKVEGCDLPRWRAEASTLVLCEVHYKEYMAARRPKDYQKHKETEIRGTLRRREADPQAYLQYMKEYGERPEVKERRLEREQKRRKADPSKHRIKNRRRAHLRRGAAGTYTEEQWQARLDFYGHRCYLCGCDWDALPIGQKTIDHVVSLSQGGTNWPSNLRPACGSCNSKKHAKPLTEILAA